MHYFRSERHQTQEKFDFPLHLLLSQQEPTNNEIHRMHFVYIHPFPARTTRQKKKDRLRFVYFRPFPSTATSRIKRQQRYTHILQIRTAIQIFRGQETLPLKMGPICCPEPSVRNYHYSLLISQKSAILIYFAAEACNHRVLFTHTDIQSATISNLLSLHFASPLFCLSSFAFPSSFLPPYSYHTFHYRLYLFLPCLSS